MDFEGSPLHQATTAAEVEALVDAGWEVETPGWMGATPLHTAAERGLAEVVAALLGRGAQVNARRPERLDTPLHFAANAAVALILLEHGAEVDGLDASRRTPLHWAAQRGRLEVAQALLRAGAAAGHLCSSRETPLHWAAEEGHPLVAQLLLEAGADPNTQDEDGRTPLHHAAWRGRAEAIELLLRAGADPGRRNRGGETPAHEARKNNRTELAARLTQAQNELAQTEHALAESPASMSLALTRVRIRPRRSEAVAIAEQAVLGRWRLADSAQWMGGMQAPHPEFSFIASDPAGALFAVTSPRNVIEWRRWDDLRCVAELLLPVGERGWLASVDVSADGRWLAVGASDERVYLANRATGQVVATRPGGALSIVAFDPTSQFLATACSEQGGGSVAIDRIEDGRLNPVAELDRTSHGTPVERFVDALCSLAFSPGGGALALFETSSTYQEEKPPGWRGNVVLYETGSWKERWTASIDARLTGDRRSLERAGQEYGLFTEVAFVGDGLLACGATRGRVLFLGVADGKLVRRVQVHDRAPVTSLAWDPVGGELWAALGAGAGELVRVPR